MEVPSNVYMTSKRKNENVGKLKLLFSLEKVQIFFQVLNVCVQSLNIIKLLNIQRLPERKILDFNRRKI